MVVIDGEMLGCIDITIDKVVDLKTTEMAGPTRRHYSLQVEARELFIINIARGDRGIGVAHL
jgi:hypothetical protein